MRQTVQVDDLSCAKLFLLFEILQAGIFIFWLSHCAFWNMIVCSSGPDVRLA